MQLLFQAILILCIKATLNISIVEKNVDKLIVIVNNDYQRELKGSSSFMDEDERLFIIRELKVVDYSYLSIDKGRDVSLTIQKIYDDLSDKYSLSFGNGGDQNNETIPEVKICKTLNIKLIDGLGNKIQSSSWLLNNKND